MYPHKEYLKLSLCFGSQNLIFQPIKCLYMASIIILPLVMQGSSAIPFTDGNFEHKKLKINTELLFALSFLQDMLCHARIPHQLQFCTPTTHISVSLFLPHGCQLAISPSAALLKITGMTLLFSSVPSKVFEASFYASEYWGLGLGFCLLLFWRGGFSIIWGWGSLITLCFLSPLQILNFTDTDGPLVYVKLNI